MINRATYRCMWVVSGLAGVGLVVWVGCCVEGWGEAVEEAGGGGGVVARGVEVEAGGERGGSDFDPGYPVVATARVIRVSLGLLEKNGADLSRPLPSRHRVVAWDREVAERVVGWGRSAGFEAEEPVVFHEHGGVERFLVDLVRVSVADPEVIEAQGREVFAALGGIEGAEYQSWMGDLVR